LDVIFCKITPLKEIKYQSRLPMDIYNIRPYVGKDVAIIIQPVPGKKEKATARLERTVA
jgi:hypothetical protein